MEREAERAKGRLILHQPGATDSMGSDPIHVSFIPVTWRKTWVIKSVNGARIQRS